MQEDSFKIKHPGLLKTGLVSTVPIHVNCEDSWFNPMTPRICRIVNFMQSNGITLVCIEIRPEVKGNLRCVVLISTIMNPLATVGGDMVGFI